MPQNYVLCRIPRKLYVISPDLQGIEDVIAFDLFETDVKKIQRKRGRELRKATKVMSDEEPTTSFYGEMEGIENGGTPSQLTSNFLMP